MWKQWRHQGRARQGDRPGRGLLRPGSRPGLEFEFSNCKKNINLCYKTELYCHMKCSERPSKQLFTLVIET